MTLHYFELAAAFLLSAFLGAIVLPKILLVSLRCRLFDMTDKRKIHHGSVPRLGGFSFFPCVCFSVFFVSAMHGLLSGGGDYFGSLDLLPFCTLILLFLMGTMDDLVGVGYRWKFAVQVVCGLLILPTGIVLGDFHGLLAIHTFPPLLAFLATTFFVVFTLNAFNLIDGIDGLASGLGMLAFLFLGCMLSVWSDWFFAILSFAGLGVLVPFFYYNVFGRVERGRKIFMGDTGSLTIGMLLSVLSIRAAMCGSSLETDSTLAASSFMATFNPLLMALSPLLVPMLDVVRVTLGRLRRRTNPFLPDKTHIHHKFMALGLSQRQALACILLLALFFIALNIVLSLLCVGATWVLLLDVVLWTLYNLLLSRHIKKSATPRA